jgi:hypothetical protein
VGAKREVLLLGGNIDAFKRRIDVMDDYRRLYERVGTDDVDRLLTCLDG